MKDSFTFEDVKFNHLAKLDSEEGTVDKYLLDYKGLLITLIRHMSEEEVIKWRFEQLQLMLPGNRWSDIYIDYDLEFTGYLHKLTDQFKKKVNAIQRTSEHLKNRDRW